MDPNNNSYMRDIKDLKELGSLYPTDKDIAGRVNNSKALKNIKKPIVALQQSNTIAKKPFDIAVQRNLRELKNPQIVAATRDRIEHIEQELLYSNYDGAVERIMETLKFLESIRN